MPHPKLARTEIDGGRLRELRQLAGLTQQALADRARISGPYISQIESGARPSISPPAFVRICDALGVPDGDRLSLIRPKVVVQSKAAV